MDDELAVVVEPEQQELAATPDRLDGGASGLLCGRELRRRKGPGMVDGAPADDRFELPAIRSTMPS